jgi:hypothetical protein
MGAVKCLPQKEDKQEETEQSKVGSTAAGSEGDFEAQLREMQKKYAESQAALEAQVKVCKVQEQRINEFQQISEQSQTELNALKAKGNSIALSASMIKYAKEGSGKPAPRRVNFLHTDSGENVVMLTTESSGAVKQYTVQGVSDDLSSASLSKSKNDEAARMLILTCDGKKVPLLCESNKVRDKWLQTIQSCLEADVNE